MHRLVYPPASISTDDEISQIFKNLVQQTNHHEFKTILNYIFDLKSQKVSFLFSDLLDKKIFLN